MEALLYVVQALFWPVVIVAFIVWLVRRGKRRREELSDTLTDVRLAADAVVRRLDRLEERVAKLETSAILAKPVAAAAEGPSTAAEDVAAARRGAVSGAVTEVTPPAPMPPTT